MANTRCVASTVSTAAVAVMAVVLLAFNQTLAPLVVLMAAGTVYVLKGTNSAINQVPDSAYPQFAHDYNAAVGAPAPLPIESPYPYDVLPIPAAFWPITPPDFITSPTFDQSVAQSVAIAEAARPVTSTEPNDVIWGYSQGAVVASQYKRDYNAAYATADPTPVTPVFVLVANPNRPNGGILERGVNFGTVPALGLTFNGATPTTTAGTTGVTTYDIARQYDGVADAPENPLNVLADLNAMMGFYYLHGHYADINPGDPQYAPNLIDQGVFGDTHYYMLATYPLPLLMPLTMIPVIGYPLADALDPALRVIVESAYNRTISPGVPTPMNLTYHPDPATFATNLATAIAVGLDNGFSDFTGGIRPLGTTRPGAFGVGGPSTPTPIPTTPPSPLPVAATTAPPSLSNTAADAVAPAKTQQQTVASSRLIRPPDVVHQRRLNGSGNGAPTLHIPSLTTTERRTVMGSVSANIAAVTHPDTGAEATPTAGSKG